MTAASRPNDLLFDALLTPHRSLGPVGFVILMAGICMLSFIAGLAFFLAGAWPVVGFLGLDVGLIYLAFRINYRRGRVCETLRLTRYDLTVERFDPWGERTTWRFQPAWLQVKIEDAPGHAGQLTLRSHGRSLSIGRFLSPAERASLAHDLRLALTRARAACRPCAPAPPVKAPARPS